MNIIESLSNFLKKKEKTTINETPEGFCPNCWGRQEYSEQFYEAVKNEGVDINNIDSKKGWVKDYADKHLLSIQLTHDNDDEVACPKCKITYRPT